MRLEYFKILFSLFEILEPEDQKSSNLYTSNDGVLYKRALSGRS
jgi:hypothetical protein